MFSRAPFSAGAGSRLALEPSQIGRIDFPQPGDDPWAQVRSDLDPKKYTVRTVPALLAKTKAWQGYDGAASSIKAAMKKLDSK